MLVLTEFTNKPERLSQLRDISYDFHDLLERKGTRKPNLNNNKFFVYFFPQKMTLSLNSPYILVLMFLFAYFFVNVFLYI